MADRHPTHHAFGEDRFGALAERAARFFGTPQYIVGQTIGVVIWVTLNSIALAARWDPYPFILLNLAFSTQAAYAAPLILLAQTRQADRDKAAAERDERLRQQQATTAAEHVEAIQRETATLKALLESNTLLTREDKKLTEEIATLVRGIDERLGRGGGAAS